MLLIILKGPGPNFQILRFNLLKLGTDFQRNVKVEREKLYCKQPYCGNSGGHISVWVMLGTRKKIHKSEA